MATMAAINRYQPIYNRFKDSTPMTNKDLKPTIEKVRKLLAFKQSSGMSVSRSIADLVRDFTADELCELQDALQLTPQELFNKR